MLFDELDDITRQRAIELLEASLEDDHRSHQGVLHLSRPTLKHLSGKHSGNDGSLQRPRRCA